MQKRSKIVVTKFLLGAIMVTVGCSSNSATEVTSTAVVATTAAVDPNSFTAEYVDGEIFESTKILETEPIALWFWAPG